MLLETITQSKNSISHIIYGKSYSNLKSSFPALDETFNNFLYFLSQAKTTSIEDLPDWPDDNIYSLKDSEGIYKNKGGDLISLRNVPSGMFPYMAFYALGTHQTSEHVQKLKGKYLTKLTKCEDQVHYEPVAFSYLIREEYFDDPENKRLVFPCLILPTVIPDELEFQWVYLAMRYFNNNISTQIDYKYLASDKKEIELLKRYNLY